MIKLIDWIIPYMYEWLFIIAMLFICAKKQPLY